VAVLQLGDRTPLGVVVVGDVAVAVSEDADVDVAGGHVGQALGERSLVGGDVVLHRDHVVLKLTQRPIGLLAVLFEVAIGGGEVDPGHVPPSPDGSAALSAWRT
jgi:hypothetical protein